MLSLIRKLPLPVRSAFDVDDNAQRLSQPGKGAATNFAKDVPHNDARYLRALEVAVHERLVLKKPGLPHRARHTYPIKKIAQPYVPNSRGRDVASSRLSRAAREALIAKFEKRQFHCM